MKNKKQIIAVIFIAVLSGAGFMRWDFMIKPKSVTDIRFWQEYDGEITCTIGSEFYSTDVDPEEFIDIVAEIKTGEKVTIDTADYTQASRNYKIGFHADHWQDYLTVRFYDDFKYVAFLEELVFKSHIPGPTDMYILENPDYIKSVFDDMKLYIPPRTQDRLEEYIEISLSQTTVGQLRRIDPDFAEHYSRYNPETDSDLKLSLIEDNGIVFSIENQQNEIYKSVMRCTFKGELVELQLKISKWNGVYYITGASIQQ